MRYGLIDMLYIFKGHTHIFCWIEKKRRLYHCTSSCYKYLISLAYESKALYLFNLFSRKWLKPMYKYSLILMALCHWMVWSSVTVKITISSPSIWCRYWSLVDRWSSLNGPWTQKSFGTRNLGWHQDLQVIHVDMFGWLGELLIQCVLVT